MIKADGLDAILRANRSERTFRLGYSMDNTGCQYYVQIGLGF